MILSLMLHILLLFSDYVIFLNYNKHICATYFYIFWLALENDLRKIVTSCIFIVAVVLAKKTRLAVKCRNGYRSLSTFPNKLSTTCD